MSAFVERLRARRALGVELSVALVLAVGAIALLNRAPLSTPYWWDEAAVYVPGSQWVATHHFAAVPGVFPSLLARGHTTLFYVITAAAFAVFGDAPVVGHLVVLAFSVVGVVATYALGARLFGRPAGIGAAALLVVAPLWLTMSVQVLPEVPLAALTALSLLAFAHGRHGWAAAFGVLVVLIKETGVACPLAITGALLLLAWRTRDLRRLARPLALSLVPTVVLAIFFVIQRVTEGWWVLPYHAELFEQDHDYLSQGAGVFRSMVLADGRGIAFVGAALIGAWRWRAHRESFAPYAHAPPRWVVLAALALVFLANQGFFTQMWFLERYALCAHPSVAVLLAGALVPAATCRAKRVWAAGAVVVLATSLVAVASAYAGEGYASGETTYRYLHMIEAHRRVFARLEAEPEPPLVMSAWPMSDELRDPSLGWVRRPYEVVGIRGYLDGGDTVQGGRPIDVIVTAEGIGTHDELVRAAHDLGMARVAREEIGGAVVELWRR